MAVRDTAVWAVGRVCEVCVELVSKPDIIQALLPALSQTLQGPPRIASNTCWVSLFMITRLFVFRLFQAWFSPRTVPLFRKARMFQENRTLSFSVSVSSN
jgi:hypothetical protein